MMRILTLSGWGQSPNTLSDICPNGANLHQCDYSDYADYEALSKALREENYDVVMGWSLGGHLALRLLGEGVIHSRSAVSLCAPHQFIRDDAQPYGMEPWLFDQFYENYVSDPERTAERFSGLIAKGDTRMKEVMRQMVPHTSVNDAKQWSPWLKFLGESSLAAEHMQHVPRTLLIQGDEDTLVQPQQSEWLLKHLENAELFSIKGCAHAPSLHDTVAVRDAIKTFIDGA